MAVGGERPHVEGLGKGERLSHDYALGINRLGRGGGSTAIAANMHIFRPWWLAWHWRAARADGDRAGAERVERYSARSAPANS